MPTPSTRSHALKVGDELGAARCAAEAVRGSTAATGRRLASTSQKGKKHVGRVLAPRMLPARPRDAHLRAQLEEKPRIAPGMVIWLQIVAHEGSAARERTAVSGCAPKRGPRTGRAHSKGHVAARWRGEGKAARSGERLVEKQHASARP